MSAQGGNKRRTHRVADHAQQRHALQPFRRGDGRQPRERDLPPRVRARAFPECETRSAESASASTTILEPRFTLTQDRPSADSACASTTLPLGPAQCQHPRTPLRNQIGIMTFLKVINESMNR